MDDVAPSQLRVLLVEDSAEDAELVQRGLLKAGIACQTRRVDTAGALIAALTQFGPDVVLSDYSMPQLDGRAVVRLVRERFPHVPVIVVSGTLGDESAAELLKLGARDFVLKDRLARLGPAVTRAIAEERGIRARKAAEAALRESELKFRRMFEFARDAILIVDAGTGVVVDLNAALEDLLGYPRQEILGRKPAEIDALKRLACLDLARRPEDTRPGKPQDVQLRRSDGRELDVMASCSRYQAGPRELLQCNLRDVSERRQAERALAESEVRFRALVEQTADVFVIAAADGTIRYISPAVATLVGYDPEAMIGASLLEFAMPEERAEVEATWARILASPGELVRAERRHQARDGTIRHVESLSRNMLDNPAIAGVAVVLRDMTARKRAELALAESETAFRTLIESTSDIIAVVDAKGTVKYVSPAVQVYGGYDPTEVVGRSFIELVHTDDASDVARKLRELATAPGATVRTEQRYRDKRGQWHHLETIARNLLDVPPVNGIVVNMRDVTDRKAAEDRLRLANMVVEASPSVLFRCRNEPGWPVDYVSENVAQWGYRQEEFLSGGRAFASLIHPDDVAQVQAIVAGELAAGSSTITAEFRMLTATGEAKWVDGRSTIERDPDGTVRSFLGLALDITERRRADADLRSSRAALAEAQAIAHVGNWTLDVATGEIAWSDESYRILGVDRASFRPSYEAVMERIDPLDRERCAAAVHDLVEHGKALSIEHRVVLPDGTRRWVHERAIAIPTSDGKSLHVIGTVQDITERRHAQEALQDTVQRVEAQLGAVGVASAIEAKSDGDIAALARDLTELAVRTVGVGRASIWLFNEAQTELRCVGLYGVSDANHGAGTVITAAEFSDAFEALRKGRYVDASDALRDPRTRAYAEKHLKPLGIGAMLDVVVQVEGRNLGLLKLSHVGGSRAWRRDEIAFACQLADKVGFALTTGKRRQIEEQLRRSNRALRAFSAGNTALVHGTDEAELYREMCRVIVEIGGYGRAWVGLAAGADQEITIVARAAAGVSGNKDDAEPVLPEALMREALREGAARFGRGADPACVVLPLQRGGKSFGVLGIGRGDEPFGPGEPPLLRELAAELAYGVGALRSRIAHEKSEQQLRETLEATVHAIASTVERRDPYTAGHQRRVSEFAVAIGREIGLAEERLRGLQLAATIHDVGKIVVPAEILTKPGRLTPLEYEMVKQHPGVGYEILKDVRFPWPIAEMVRQHHERMDGSGYPRGLKGEEILLEARILAVADIVEAIASHRPYRPSLGLELALKEVELGRGARYDTDVVDACLRLFRYRNYSLPL